MERTVHEGDLKALDGIAGEDTILHSILEALLDGGNELLGHITALDLVDESKTKLTLVCGLDADDDVGELTTATSLLLEDLAVLARALDSLAVGHLGLTLVALDLELTAETVENDVKVELTHALDDGLASLLVGVEAESRILLGELKESVGEFVHILSALWLDRDADDGLREVHRLESDRCILIAKSITSLDILKTDSSADVASVDAVERYLLVGLHLVETGDTLLLVRTSVEDIRACVDMARVDTDVGETTYERVSGDLEGEGCHRSVDRVLTGLSLASVGVGALNWGKVERAGEESDDGVEKTLDTLVAERRSAEDRVERLVDSSLTESLNNLLLREGIGLKELLHKRLVLSGDLLEHLGAPLLGLCLEALADLLVLEG